jgi:hypothetical protein
VGKINEKTSTAKGLKRYRGDNRVRMLDLFCGRFGWGRAFAARGWEVVGVDLVQPSEIPKGCHFSLGDVLTVGTDGGGEIHMDGEWSERFDFICASSPCEQFSLFGMKHFHPNPPYPELGIRLFNNAREMCEASGIPYVMENVRPAQSFVGRATHHCGPFFLWGNAVPPLLPQGITKAKWTMQKDRPGNAAPECWLSSKARAAKLATIPPELANCVADYAERITQLELAV